MKIKINKEVISALRPCKERFDNYLESYNNFNGDIQKFLDLANISHSDKLWVAFRVIPRSILEVFSIDCAFSAAYAAKAANAVDAAYTAAAATYVADAAAEAAYAANAADAADAAAAAYAAADAAATYAANVAATYADATAATYVAYVDAAAAAYAAADAANAVADAAARKKEQENQIAVLKYLISEEK